MRAGFDEQAVARIVLGFLIAFVMEAALTCMKMVSKPTVNQQTAAKTVPVPLMNTQTSHQHDLQRNTEFLCATRNQPVVSLSP